jgi:hypothetical protein
LCRAVGAHEVSRWWWPDPEDRAKREAVRLKAAELFGQDVPLPEGVWANVKGTLGNLAARGIDQLAAIVKSRLKRIQYRPGLIAGTGLVEPQPR